MVAITLTREQSSIVASADRPVIVRDTAGREVAVLMPMSDPHAVPLSIKADEWEAILNRMQDDPATARETAEVIRRIKSRAG